MSNTLQAKSGVDVTVKYYMGLNAAGGLVHIENAVRGGNYACAGCGKELTAKMGEVNAHHFAHKPPGGEDCDRDATIHNLAVRAIADSHMKARADGYEYPLMLQCRRCESSLVPMLDLASGYETALVETEIVERTRSDVAFPGEPPLIIEVVVTHSIERETRERYERAGARVYTATLERDDWDAVRALSWMVLANDTDDDARSPSCLNCEAKRWREEESRRRSEKAQELVARTFDKLRRPRKPSPIRYQIDRLRHFELTEGQRRFCAVAGQKLGMMGFQQSNSAKPWLFERDVEIGDKKITVWAELDVLLTIEPRFYTSVKFSPCPNGHAPLSQTGWYDAERLDNCPRCAAMVAVENEVSRRMSIKWESLMESGRRRRTNAPVRHSDAETRVPPARA